MRQKSLAASVGRVGPLSRSRCVAHATSTHTGGISVENISNVCPQHALVFSPRHSSGEFKSTLQRCSNQFTMDPHCTYDSIHSSTLQLHTPDLEICLSSRFTTQSTTLRKISLNLCFPSLSATGGQQQEHAESKIPYATKLNRLCRTQQL